MIDDRDNEILPRKRDLLGVDDGFILLRTFTNFS